MKNILLLACLLPAISLANTNPADLWITQKNDSRPVLQTDGKSQLAPKNIQQHNQQLNYTIAIRYPQITGVQLNTGAKHFNQLTQDFIDKQVTAFKQDIAHNAANPSLPQMTSYLKINYEMAGFVSQSQHTDYTSIRYSIDTFVRGMAHPAQQTQVFNFDVEQNKPLALPDLFKPHTDYLSVIANYCQQQLQAKQIPPVMLQSGTAPQLTNYKNWNITLSGLLITFDEAQVAPRYFGKQEVLVPNSVLKDIVNHQTACTMSIIRCDVT